MAWLLVFLPAFGFVAAGLLYPSPEPPPRWRTRAAGLLERLAKRLRPRPTREIDPFDVLSVQLRLSAIAADLRSIEDEPHMYAKAHHLHAAHVAYDDLLFEACRLAGLDAGPRLSFSVPEERRVDQRLREEVDLAALGWTW